MKIIADENLAYTEYFFADFADIQQVAGRTITPHQLKESQALLIRSVTQVNAQLLQQTAVQFVGSATIGTDHLDIDYLNQQHITWANAAGCNAQAVAEYVITALLTLQPQLIDAQQDFCLGIVGLGNVGTRLARLALSLGWQVIATDPFVQQDQIAQGELDDVLTRANAISLHVPLTTTGIHATKHLFNRNVFNKMQPNCILVNSSRGAVIVEQDLLQDIEKTQRQVVLDVFPHEPQISQHLLQALALATPHIAGYSLEGKARGTEMIYQAFCQKFAFQAEKTFQPLLAPCPPYFASYSPMDDAFKAVLMQYLAEIYPIRRDDQQLRACVQHGVVQQQDFDLLRKNYPLRREWSAYGLNMA